LKDIGNISSKLGIASYRESGERRESFELDNHPQSTDDSDVSGSLSTAMQSVFFNYANPAPV
jgi:hypothetical protein